MNTLETILKRYSCRNFDGKQITESDLDLIIKSGMSAPVARGLYENLHITVVQDEALIKEIFDVTEEEMYKLSNVRRNMNFGAKTYIIVSSINPTNMEYVNAGCIVENMILAATSLNINTVMMAAPTRSIADKTDSRSHRQSQSRPCRRDGEQPQSYHHRRALSSGDWSRR